MITTSIDTAIKLLDNNDVIALPTETVYGLAGNAFSKKAIEKIYKLKKRPNNNPLIVHIGSTDQLQNVAKNIPEIAYKLAAAFWPGPLTLLLEKQENIPDSVTAGLSTVGVRIPNHQLALDLLNKLDYPLAAPSANPFNAISPTSSKHVAHYFGNQLKCILEGGHCVNGIESTIIGFDATQQPVLYRHGAISIQEIEALIGKIKNETYTTGQPIAPGMLSKHYAPKTKIIKSNNLSESIQAYKTFKIGLIVFNELHVIKQVEAVEVLSKTGDFKEATRNFYAALHRLDEIGLDIIIAEEMPMYDLGLTLNDRLNRAIK